MPRPVAPYKRRPTLIQRWQRLVQVRWWKMDIHPSARIASTALIDRTWPRGVHIGAEVIVDEEAVVLTHDLTRGVYLDTKLAEGASVGARAIILPGVTIGAGAVVEPGSVVNRDVAAGSRVAGNPARAVADDT